MPLFRRVLVCGLSWRLQAEFLLSGRNCEENHECLNQSEARTGLNGQGSGNAKKAKKNGVRHDIS